MTCPGCKVAITDDEGFVKVERVRILNRGEYGATAELLRTFAVVACSLECAGALIAEQMLHDPQPASPRDWITA